MWLFIIGSIVAMYYRINIRGYYPVSKQVSNKIMDFLDHPDTYQEHKDDYYKYFVCGNSQLKVWSRNWPDAYGSRGLIHTNKRCVYAWHDENLSYSVRRRLKNFSCETIISKVAR